MTRAPFVTGKAQEAFSRSDETFDTTIGWRFINPLMKQQYGVDSMPETGENVAEEFQVKRADQDAFAVRSQQRAGKAIASGYFAEEIVPVEMPGGKAGPIVVDKDEHPRPDTTLESLAKLKTPFRNPGTVTAGNASGVNDGAAAHDPCLGSGGEEARPERRAPAFSAWRRRACRRASWASARCRRRAS